MIEFAEKELEILKKLPKNDNLVEFISGEVLQIEYQIWAVFIFELCNQGSLFQYLTDRKNSRIEEKEIISIFSEICT